VGSRFRFTAADPRIKGWLCGNLRLTEVVFEGSERGSSHPDLAAKRPIAVLFDEEAFDTLGGTAAKQETYPEGGAFSGGIFLRHPGGSQVYAPLVQRPFGQVFRGWDFVIKEHPGPGEYRWMQFAVKALQPGVRAAGIRPGPGGRSRPGPQIQLGDASLDMLKFGQMGVYSAGADIPTEWTLVTVDLWDVLARCGAVDGARFRICDLLFTARGGPVGFDRILLARTKEDLNVGPD
jgi:hypothetical protein